MKDAVLAFTADGGVLHSNSAAHDMFAEELDDCKMTLEKSFEALDIPLVIEGNRVRLTSPDIEAEITKDGFIFRDRICDSRVYDVSFAVIRYVDGKQPEAGCVLIIHDVTGRYELDESRREFVANVSHELRTPLTAIKGAAETVRMDPEMDTEMKEYFLDMVLSESDRMTRIVSDLLVLSRLDNKKTKWSIETFDLTQSVRRLIEVMRPNLEEHSHTISFGVEKTLPEITADRGRIEQVIINIISNAIKYTSDGGQIDVKLTANESNKRVKVIVSDNGIGIPEEDVAHLFERFYRVEKSRNQDAGGTGLGLAIAKELVEAHGGSIYVKSTLGVGTVVTVELPVECKLKSE
jgi:two-component system sensor histidine kinase VicK